MRPLIPLRVSLESPHLLEPLMGGETREAMRAILLASQGEPLTDSEYEHWTRLTLREEAPMLRAEECHIVGGRRSGKTSGLAALAIWASALCDYRDCLTIGERGVVLIVAENQRQAKILFRYIAAGFYQSPVLAKMIEGETALTLTLNNNTAIEVHSADFRAIRGMSVVLACVDEIAMLRNDQSANPDFEIVEAIRPALVTTRGQLFTIGSPYSRRGFQYDVLTKHYKTDGDPRIIVAKGATRLFNPTVSQSVVDKAMARDPVTAAAEWLAEARSDRAAFVSFENVMRCVCPGLHEIPPELGVQYTAFADAATGTGTDSFAFCIGHMNGEKCVIDCLRNITPKFSPDAVVAELSQLAQTYGITTVCGDNFASGLVRELWARNSINYEPVKENKSQLYINLLGVINSGMIDLPDDKKMIQELVNLERRTGFGARSERVDHPDGPYHDDSANVIAGIASVIREDSGGYHLDMLLRSVGLKPTLFQERQQQKAKEEQQRKEAERLEAERKAQDAASQASQEHDDSSQDDQLLPDDSNSDQPQPIANVIQL
jgi:hypothetical protein